ncbi:MAG: Asp-tRNA(Asn)/Glu-tRNA(Gln) amidotransferase subunit GatC [Halobacteriovoraceae bacterium]|nr:Asp-tRNA(Asn)/Glu-tRNA(Gln) amidotransferase subunit GatC [Halobacteriovoraceae bacterium]
MDKIDEKTVKHIASLARIKLSPLEIKSYKKDLERILEYVNLLNEVDTENITSEFSKSESLYRQDKILPSLPMEDLLDNSPASKGACYKVDGVLETE